MQAVNNLSAADNMRINQSRFKQAFADKAGGLTNTAFRRQDGSQKQRASGLRHASKQLKVRFSIDEDSCEEVAAQQYRSQAPQPHTHNPASSTINSGQTSLL